jgi:Putative homoserine kinase type II (protein kinase fold)
VGALRAGWGIAPVVRYLPAGFGSHHWVGEDGAGPRWFITVDDLAAKVRQAGEPLDVVFGRLRAALRTVRAVADGGAGYAVAPLPRRDGEVLARAGERYAVAVYPYVDGVSPGWGARLGDGDLRAVLGMLADLHATPEGVRARARVEDFALPGRADLADALGALGQAWDTGPYGERARAALAAHAREIEGLLNRYDRLVAQVREEPGRMVLTHGEPHPGNLLRRADGEWLLIDWDTVLVAPPERDLWHLDPGDGSVLDAYARRTGRAVRPAAAELYRLSWRLAEIAYYGTLFRREHRESADVRKSWEGLVHYLNQG